MFYIQDVFMINSYLNKDMLVLAQILRSF